MPHPHDRPALTRRESLAALAALALQTGRADRRRSVSGPCLQTVLGPVSASRIGRMLPHEHVMVDFIGADRTGPHRWDVDEVCRTMRPFLEAARKAGVTCIAECTPMYLGRDVRILQRLARETGLAILTNTGLYKAPYLPPYAFEEDADALAQRWIREWREGIEGSDVRPGFIKIAVNPGRLEPVQVKIVRAAAQTSNATGMPIACHTGHGEAALECLEILREERTPPGRFIFVHADAEPAQQYHLRVARAGAWIEYDSIGWRPLEEHVRLIKAFLKDGPPDRLLLSHDAGWYHVGEAGGGEIKPMTPLFTDLLPALEREGIARKTLDALTRSNPVRAFSLETRRG